MLRRSEHTYALPSSRNSPQRSPNQSRSAPPSPGGGILLATPIQYGSTVPQPLAYRHANWSSSSLPTTPRAPSPKVTMEPPLQAQSVDRMGYDATKWSLVAIERPQIRAKYVVSLLYWPTKTLYTWPIDPRKPPAQGTCFVTRVDVTDQLETDANGTLRKSLRLLEDCLRAWIRYTRSSSHPRSRSPSGTGRIVATDTEIEQVSMMLHLQLTTPAARAQWLSRQNVPDVIPVSTPTSPVVTPGSIREEPVRTPGSGTPGGMTLSPTSVRRAPSGFAPVSPPSQDGRRKMPMSHKVTLPPEPETGSRGRAPAVLVTEPAPAPASLPTMDAVHPKKSNLDSAIEALSLQDGPSPVV